MERLILKRLLEWKNSPYRKPLILKGVRQVGKTWILKEFGRRYYDNTAYFNFDEHEEYKQFFETTKDVDRLLQNLMLASGQKITPEKTLIIFDEVQDCPKVINSTKSLAEALGLKAFLLFPYEVLLRECAAVSHCLCRFAAGHSTGKAVLLPGGQGQLHADRSNDVYGVFAGQR